MCVRWSKFLFLGAVFDFYKYIFLFINNHSLLYCCVWLQFQLVHDFAKNVPPKKCHRRKLEGFFQLFLCYIFLREVGIVPYSTIMSKNYFQEFDLDNLLVLCQQDGNHLKYSIVQN